MVVAKGVTEIAEHIERDQAGNVHSEPISVPEANSPFVSVEDEQAFAAAVQELQAADYEPALFTATVAAGYEPYQYIRYGRRGKKELRVVLPHEIWYPRALLWAQALHVLSHLMDNAG